ncbi:hypothetical protein ACFQYP_34120 [Nonomuraea antimicrobica]|uniref:hypothetical protein n=1 Tax=Nonomuraea antimicrobica TaxID=561173 RepID=UPI0031EEF120
MSTSASRKLITGLLLALLLVSAVVFVASHVRRPSWQRVIYVTPSEEGRVLTARLMFGEPKPDGSPCEQVTDTEVHETKSHVRIGIQTVNTCAPLIAWRATIRRDIGYPFDVRLSLRNPLAGRAVLDWESGQRLEIGPLTGRS